MFFDARVNGGIEIRGADCMPPKFILAYAQLVRSIFGSQAALQNVLRHYPGVTTVDIANAKLAVCKDGFNAWVYGKLHRRRAGLAADAGPQPHALAGGAVAHNS